MTEVSDKDAVQMRRLLQIVAEWMGFELSGDLKVDKKIFGDVVE